METDMSTTSSPDQPGNLEERIARLETSIEALVARLDRQESAAAQSGHDRPGRNWREQAHRSFGAADNAFRRMFEARPVLAAAGLVVAAVVLIKLLD